MDELNLKDYLPEVEAPADFEKRVLAAVAARKKKGKSFFIFPGLSLSWRVAAVAASLALLVTLSFLVFPKLDVFFGQRDAGIFSSGARPGELRESFVTLTEPVDFHEEFSGLQRSKVIYILEPVDDRFLQEIRY